ncbi:MAG: hypothetical protein JWN13_6912 [Betaproteobacteria bacterium]|jgi:hypothetical protein|nr:hypothetical protein [Betaproteobacteria bacterium]
MDDWEFYQGRDDRWFWRNVKREESTLSAERFTSFVEVVASARKNGYDPGISRVASVTADRRLNPRAPPSRAHIRA